MVFQVISRIISTPLLFRDDSIYLIFNTLRKPIQLLKVLKKVREFICVVYTASQPFGAGFFVCLSPPTRVGTNHYVAGWYLGTYRTPGSQPSYLSPGSAPAYL